MQHFCLVSIFLAQKKSELSKEEICFFVSWYTLPRALNFKPIFEFQSLQAQKYPDGTSELIPLAPTRIYVEIVHYVEIVPLAQNYPASTSELFLLDANLDLHGNCTLRRNFPAGTKFSCWRSGVI